MRFIAKGSHGLLFRRAWPAPTLNFSGRPCFVGSCKYSIRSSPDDNRTDSLPEARHVKDKEFVQGFVKSVRRQKNVAFVDLVDGTNIKPLQAVLSPELADGLTTGAAIKLGGRKVVSRNEKKQREELEVSSVELLGKHDSETYPIQKKYHTNEFLRTIPHLRTRTLHNALLLRVRSHVLGRIHQFFAKSNFYLVHPPLITSSDCEGAGEVFSVDHTASDQSGSVQRSGQPFFMDKKYLTVSSQLHLEALAASVRRVWTLSPTFRAERSDTPRHLSEFYMLEAEEMFVDDLESVMLLVRQLISDIANDLTNSTLSSELLEAAVSRAQGGTGATAQVPDLAQRWENLGRAERWPTITYTEAVQILQQASTGAKFKHQPIWGHGLQAEHEKHLANTVGKNGPVFITDYPQKIKAFYMALSPKQEQSELADGLTVSCFDLVVPELCEIAGGSIREHDLDRLQTNLGGEQAAKNLQWYLDLRRYGSAPHGGFGLGFDRLLCYLTGVNSIRDMVAFPRWYGRCDC